MKRAGEVLSAIFDERLMKKARGYSRLFDFWAEAVQKNGISAAADHSRIKELDRGILLIEAEHPGWKQILQTKQNRLLNDFRRQFPDLDISGISLMLSRDGQQTTETTDIETVTDTAEAEESAPVLTAPQKKTDYSGYDAIKDEGFKETLKRLEQSIFAGEKTRAKKVKNQIYPMKKKNQ